MVLQLLTFLAAANLAPAALAGFDPLVVQLQKLRGELEIKSVDTTPETTTLNGTYAVFSAAAVWDAAHASVVADSWCAFDPKKSPADCAALAASETANQSAQLSVVLQDAVSAAQWALQNPAGRRSSPRPALGPGTAILSRVDGGYLVRNGTATPFFPNGFNLATPGANQEVACGLGTVEVILSPQAFLPDGPTPDPNHEGALSATFEEAGLNGNFVSGFLLGNALPPWAAAEYPGVNDCVPPLCKSHFMEYDWLNPGALAVMTAFFNASLGGPAVNATGILGGAAVNAVLLVNEPGVMAVNSSAAQAAFSAFLGVRYGTVDALNAAYGSAYVAISDVPVSPTPVSPVTVAGGAVWNASNLEAARRWFDWQSWSQSSFRGYFQALGHAARAAVAESPALAPLVTHLKIAANHLGGQQHSHGLDLLGFLADHGISAADSRAGPGNMTVFARPQPSEPGLYSGFYLSQLTYFPFARSLAPLNPLFDSETHDVSTDSFRGAMPRGYPRFFEWLSVLLGRALSLNWYWGRDANGARPNLGKNNDWFPDSTLTQPYALDEHSRALWELGTVSEEVRSLVSNGPRPAAVWYSRLSLVSEPAAASSLVRAAEIATFLPLGRQIGFVAERLMAGRQLQTGATGEAALLCSADATCIGRRAAEEAAGAVRLSAFEARGPSPAAGAPSADTAVVIVPLAPYAEDDALAALRAWLAGNSTRRLIVMAANCPAGPAGVPACSLFRLRANATQRPLQELTWLDGEQVAYVEPRDPQAMLETTAAVVAKAGGIQAAAACLVDGQAAMGVACWVAPGDPPAVRPTLFAVNMRSSSVTFSVQIGGKPLTTATSLLLEPPFGVPAPDLPTLTLDPLRVAVLQL